MAESAAPSVGGIFISYRREESSYPAVALYKLLADRYGPHLIFKDVDSILLGDVFANVIADAVGHCDVLLALIGEKWLTITDAHDRRRLDNPDDFVRLEIEAALTRNVRVIPILVDGARMPDTDEVPPSLAGLVDRQALELSPNRFDFDTSRLLEVLDGTLAEAHDDAASPAKPPGKPAEPTPPPPRPPPRRTLRARPLLAMTALIAFAAVAFWWFVLEERTPEQPAEEPAPAAGDFAVGDLQWSETTPDAVTIPGRVEAIVWHDDRFAAVGWQMAGEVSDALVLTSSDGLQWDLYDADASRGPQAQSMLGLAVGPNGMIAVGTEGVRPDQDAAVWLFEGDEVRQVDPMESMTAGHREMAGVVWDDDHDRYVAVGCVDQASDTVCDQTKDGTQRAGVWTSIDGTQWEEVDRDEIEQGEQTAMRDIARTGDGLLVAVGHQQSGDEATRRSALWTSTDGGQHWKWIDLPQDPDSQEQSVLEVAAGDDGIVACGYDRVGDLDAAIWYSADGQQWEARLIEGRVAENQVMRGITAAGDGFVGVGRHYEGDVMRGVIWVSADGKTWTRQQSDDLLGDNTVLSAAAASEDRVIAAGGTGGGIGAVEFGELRLWTGALAE